jgi:hypothetical protein
VHIGGLLLSLFLTLPLPLPLCHGRRRLGGCCCHGCHDRGCPPSSCYPKHGLGARHHQRQEPHHIPFAFELDPPNYSTWRELFLTLAGKFSASSHIDGTPSPKEPDAAWLAIDCSVSLLIYSSSSPCVIRLIMEIGASARGLDQGSESLPRQQGLSGYDPRGEVPCSDIGRHVGA